jgi:hypothetical protein
LESLAQQSTDISVVMITGRVDGFFIAHGDLADLQKAGRGEAPGGMESWLRVTDLLQGTQCLRARLRARRVKAAVVVMTGMRPAGRRARLARRGRGFHHRRDHARVRCRSAGQHPLRGVAQVGAVQSCMFAV